MIFFVFQWTNSFAEGIGHFGGGAGDLFGEMRIEESLSLYELIKYKYIDGQQINVDKTLLNKHWAGFLYNHADYKKGVGLVTRAYQDNVFDRYYVGVFVDGFSARLIDGILSYRSPDKAVQSALRNVFNNAKEEYRTYVPRNVEKRIKGSRKGLSIQFDSENEVFHFRQSTNSKGLDVLVGLGESCFQEGQKCPRVYLYEVIEVEP